MLVAMSLRCVIVDDDPGVLRAAGELLERQGLAIVGRAGNGDDALRIVGEVQPDVVLVDIDLGAESGFDLTRRLVRDLEASGSRTILISARDQAGYEDLIAASPAIGFLSKSELSAAAIRGLVDGRRDGGRY
jgi:two-component system, NarL family, nitrate/nitrite response regulator NarL